jgi:ubiquinone/menaquinone biosynthesis C-methylase UbiE
MPGIEERYPERIDVPERVQNHTQEEHRARYAWAAERLSGRVLDVACGTGHGSRVLAGRCTVAGIDQDKGAVEQASGRVPGGEFIVASVPPIPFGDAAFDAITSFETIEHLDDDVGFMAELRRVLRPGGHLLVSTPNRAVTSPNDAVPKNRYHVREYLLPEFVALARDAGFEQVDVYYQRQAARRVPEYVASAVIARVPSLCRPGRWWDRMAHGTGDVVHWTQDIPSPLFWVLDCY